MPRLFALPSPRSLCTVPSSFQVTHLFFDLQCADVPGNENRHLGKKYRGDSLFSFPFLCLLKIRLCSQRILKMKKMDVLNLTGKLDHFCLLIHSFFFANHPSSSGFHKGQCPCLFLSSAQFSFMAPPSPLSFRLVPCDTSHRSPRGRLRRQTKGVLFVSPQKRCFSKSLAFGRDPPMYARSVKTALKLESVAG